MEVVCPECRRVMTSSELNIAMGLAHCTPCGHVYVLSELMLAEESLDLDAPPKGVVFRRTEDGFQIRATTRSAEAFFWIPLACMYSGASLGGLYVTLVAGQAELGRALFCIPGIILSMVSWSVALMAAVGKVVIDVSGDRMTIFIGVGAFGFRQRASFLDLRQVRLRPSTRSDGHPRKELALEGTERCVSFGSGMSERRQSFVVRALQRMLAEHRPPQPLPPPGALSLAANEDGRGCLSHPDAPEGALSAPRDRR